MAGGEYSKSVQVVIEGRVQGVWYRAWTVKQATELGLDGWVRNRSNGSVEALFSGPEKAVNRMIAECRKGPPAALVTDIKEVVAPPPAEKGFHNLPTI